MLQRPVAADDEPGVAVALGVDLLEGLERGGEAVSRIEAAEEQDHGLAVASELVDLRALRPVAIGVDPVRDVLVVEREVALERVDAGGGDDDVPVELRERPAHQTAERVEPLARLEHRVVGADADRAARDRERRDQAHPRVVRRVHVHDVEPPLAEQAPERLGQHRRDRVQRRRAVAEQRDRGAGADDLVRARVRRTRIVDDLGPAQKVSGDHRDLVAARRQTEGLGMNDFADATQLREAVVRHYRDPHAGTIPGTADVLLPPTGPPGDTWVSFSPWKPPSGASMRARCSANPGIAGALHGSPSSTCWPSHSCCLTARDIADELRARGERTGIASVYRALDLLHELGLVKRLDVGDGTARYEPADPSGEHHHHLVCDRCGLVDGVRGRSPRAGDRTRSRSASTTRSTRTTSCFAAPARTAAPPRRRHLDRRRRAA